MSECCQFERNKIIMKYKKKKKKKKGENIFDKKMKKNTV